MNRITPPVNPPWRIFDGILILIIINLVALLFRFSNQEWLFTLVNFLPGGITVVNKLLINSIIQTGLFLILIAYYVFVKYKSGISQLGLVKTKLAFWLRIGIIHGVVLFFAITFLGVLINMFFPVKIEPQPVAQAIMKVQNGWEVVVVFLVVSLFAPVSEELYFRGFLYPTLRRRLGIKGGIIVTSLIFGGLHLDLIRMIPLAFGGVWLNWLYERSGSIYTSIMAHSVWNGIMTVLILVPQLI